MNFYCVLGMSLRTVWIKLIKSSHPVVNLMLHMRKLYVASPGFLKGGGLRGEEMRFLEDALGIRGVPAEKEGNREWRTR